MVTFQLFGKLSAKRQQNHSVDMTSTVKSAELCVVQGHGPKGASAFLGSLSWQRHGCIFQSGNDFGSAGSIPALSLFLSGNAYEGKTAEAPATFPKTVLEKRQKEPFPWA